MVGVREPLGVGNARPELERAIQQPCRLAIGVHPLHGASRGERRGEGPGLVAGGVVVVGDPGRGPGPVAPRGGPLERMRRGQVKLRALAGQQIVVEHLAQEGVAEGVAPGVVDDDDLGGDRLAYRYRELGGGDPGAVGEQLVARPAGNREQAQQLLAVGRQALDPEQERLPQARRQRGAGVDAGREELFGEQRVALAAPVHPVDHLPVGRGPEDVGELVGKLVTVEALELDPLGAGAALELGEQRAQRMSAVQLVGAVGGDDHRRLLRQAGLEEAQERPGRAVGPVDVLDPQEHRLLGAEARDQLEEGVEEAPLGLAALGLRLAGRPRRARGSAARARRESNPGARRAPGRRRAGAACSAATRGA